MSINFDHDMGPEAAKLIKEAFGVPEAMDNRTALFNKMRPVNQKQMGNIARAAQQVATVEIAAIGDRKDVGGVVYEKDEIGWRRLPIGTKL